jgi:hypothetical protein
MTALAASALLGADTVLAQVDPTAPKPDWDQVANVKDAAARIGRLQRAKGAEAAYKFIDACYRTHSLAENYTAGFEACIVQDYLQTKMLVEIYQRTSPEQLRKYGSPSPEKLADTMGRRISAAFAQYKIPADQAEAFKVTVDRYGLPVFMAAVFPEAIRELNAAEPEGKPSGKSKK